AVNVYCTEPVEMQMRREFAYIFSEHKYPGIPDIHLHRISTELFHVNGIPVQPVEVMHYKLPVLGFRFGDFAYITDANFISEEEKKKLRNCKFLVLNALRKEQHISHFTLDEAVALIRELAPEQAFLTHISHQLGKHKEVSLELPPNIQLAYDGLVVSC